MHDPVELSRRLVHDPGDGLVYFVRDMKQEVTDVIVFLEERQPKTALAAAQRLYAGLDALELRLSQRLADRDDRPGQQGAA